MTARLDPSRSQRYANPNSRKVGREVHRRAKRKKLPRPYAVVVGDVVVARGPSLEEAARMARALDGVVQVLPTPDAHGAPRECQTRGPDGRSFGRQ